jgi:hypothetical protein
MTDVYKRMRTAEGVTTERFYELLDQSDDMAYDNVKERTPKFNALLKSWEAQSAGKEAPN